jgi:hypothetical protein
MPMLPQTVEIQQLMRKGWVRKAADAVRAFQLGPCPSPEYFATRKKEVAELFAQYPRLKQAYDAAYDIGPWLEALLRKAKARRKE